MNKIITHTADLKTLMDQARDSDAVGLDTEFIWERTYYPRLGLVQLSLSDEDCYLIDPLAIDDLTPLGQLLNDTAVVKIFHDAPQDLSILSNATGGIPKNIFDTRLGAGFAGFPSILSLSNLVKELLDIELSKSQTRTNWLRRPLKKSQIQYGLDDVRYLRAVRVLILARCVNQTTKNWLELEMERFDSLDDFNGVEDDQRYLRVKGYNRLNRKSLSVLRELGSWREKEAKLRDRPRGHIITDKGLLCIARNLPQSISELEKTCLLSERKVKKYGKQIDSCIQLGQNVPKEEYPPSPQYYSLSLKEKKKLQQLQNMITLECDILGIDPALMGNKDDLKKLTYRNFNLNDCRDLRLGSGWRKILLTDLLANEAI